MLAPQRVRVAGTPVDLCSPADFVTLTTRWAIAGRRATVVGVNAHVVNLCARDDRFAAAVGEAALAFPDGQSVVWAARLLGHRPRGRVPLTHMTDPMCRAWAAAGLPVFLLGGRPGVAERAGARLADEYGLVVAGTRHGYFAEHDEPEMVAAINRSGARILLVGLGNPGQELWLARHRAALVPPVALTCGGWLDWTAGERRPCPRFVYRLGLEWAYRLAQEPRRLFTRYVVGNPRFVYHVLRYGIAHQ
jgi:exopolysaccharide biosynthesis WecB/TagA/CpsF family protein